MVVAASGCAHVDRPSASPDAAPSPPVSATIRTRSVETTASIPAAQPAPAGRVQSQPLPPVNAQAAAAADARPDRTPSRPTKAWPAAAAAWPRTPPIRRAGHRCLRPTSPDRWPRPGRRRPATGPGKAAPRSPSRRATPSRAFPAATACRRPRSCRPTTSRRPAPSIRDSSWSFRATSLRRSQTRCRRRAPSCRRRQSPWRCGPRPAVRSAIPACTWSRPARR